MYSLLTLLRDSGLRIAAIGLFLILAAQTFCGPLDMTVFEKRQGLEAPIIAKLAIAMLMGIASLWGVWRFSSVSSTLMAIPVVYLWSILLLSVMGATSGVTDSSIPCAAINATTIAFTAVCLTLFGIRTFSFAIACGTFVAISVALYLFYLNPEQGVFLEPVGGTEYVSRLGGIGHPNTVARSALLGFLLTVYLVRTKELPLLLAALLIAVFAWGIFLAQSRTSMIAGLLSLVLLFSDRLTLRTATAGATILSFLLLIGLFLLLALGQEDRLINQVVGKVTKSGDASELTTGTGRTEIWNESIRVIAERPLRGYGFQSSSVLLTNFAQSTHNAVLNSWMAGGLVAGLIMLMLQLKLAWNAVTIHNPLIQALSSYLFISCLIEDTVFENTPGPGTLLWFACCLLPVISPKSITDGEL